MAKRYTPAPPVKMKNGRPSGSHGRTRKVLETVRTPAVVEEVPGAFLESVEEQTEGGRVRDGVEEDTNVSKQPGRGDPSAQSKRFRRLKPGCTSHVLVRSSGRRVCGVTL